MTCIRVCFGYADDAPGQVMLGQRNASLPVGLPPRRAYVSDNGDLTLIYTMNITPERCDAYIRPHEVENKIDYYDEIMAYKNKALMKAVDDIEKENMFTGDLIFNPNVSTSSISNGKAVMENNKKETTAKTNNIPIIPNYEIKEIKELKDGQKELTNIIKDVLAKLNAVDINTNVVNDTLRKADTNLNSKTESIVGNKETKKNTSLDYIEVPFIESKPKSVAKLEETIFQDYVDPSIDNFIIDTENCLEEHIIDNVKDMPEQEDITLNDYINPNADDFIVSIENELKEYSVEGLFEKSDVNNNTSSSSNDKQEPKPKPLKTGTAPKKTSSKKNPTTTKPTLDDIVGKSGDILDPKDIVSFYASQNKGWVPYEYKEGDKIPTEQEIKLAKSKIIKK